MEQTLALAREVEAVLQGPDWLAFLPQMYGSQPALWDEALVGTARQRCILNSLTRIRYCASDGSMDFSSAAEKRSDRLPWFEVPGRAAANTPIIFGHWSALGLTLRSYVSGLDSGCVWGGKLSAMRLEDRKIFQVDCAQYQIPELS
jgi:bis(5'-nucleosyl)-tetraphosphatase (symmetrical)